MFSTGAFALAIIALFTSLVHLGVVRHERCAEHGEVIDVAVNTPHADTSLSHDPQTRAQTQDALHSLPSGAADSEHEHCPLATTPSTPTSTSAVVNVTSIAAPVALVAAPPVRNAVIRDVLIDAPKQGPPLRNV